MHLTDKQNFFRLPIHWDFQSEDVSCYTAKHEQQAQDGRNKAGLGMESTLRANSRSTDDECDEKRSDGEGQGNHAENGVNNLAPLPVMAPVTIREDLQQTYESPGRPHEDTMRVVLWIVIDH